MDDYLAEFKICQVFVNSSRRLEVKDGIIFYIFEFIFSIIMDIIVSLYQNKTVRWIRQFRDYFLSTIIFGAFSKWHIGIKCRKLWVNERFGYHEYIFIQDSKTDYTRFAKSAFSLANLVPLIYEFVFNLTVGCNEIVYDAKGISTLGIYLFKTEKPWTSRDTNTDLPSRIQQS